MTCEVLLVVTKTREALYKKPFLFHLSPFSIFHKLWTRGGERPEPLAPESQLSVSPGCATVNDVRVAVIDRPSSVIVIVRATLWSFPQNVTLHCSSGRFQQRGFKCLLLLPVFPAVIPLSFPQSHRLSLRLYCAEEMTQTEHRVKSPCWVLISVLYMTTEALTFQQLFSDEASYVTSMVELIQGIFHAWRFSATIILNLLISFVWESCGNQ